MQMMPTSEISCGYTDFQQGEIEEITKHAEAMNVGPLPDAVTDLVHGVEERQAAEAAASALFGRGELSDLTASKSRLWPKGPRKCFGRRPVP